MALSIGVSVKSRVRVGDSVLAVREVLSSTAIVVSLDDGPEFVITDRERTQILPGVYVFAGVGNGKDKGSQNTPRLAFEAPIEVRIKKVEDGHAGT